MPGPPPTPNSRRRNASPTANAVIPATLPADHKAPTCPYKLGPAGRKWWRSAWKLLESTQWRDADVYAVARRAEIEDDLASLKFNDELDLADLLAGADKDAIKRVEWALEQLKRMASGKTTLGKEADQLEDRLGLNPKSRAALRWTYAVSAAPVKAADVSNLDDFRARSSG